ncbi:cytoskeletal protein Syp1 [Schizosaccharomyces japonicus yFS275]|uniref:Cytoskeletal protein Syp1 n=1 Tax=Schizosaccharomyces japonicus (strain yFS275 / FY16936) TaxID=402676 RepID=B6K3G2_SCHJY|nr:cytoskeletal protein Syp1 [Schizosaccharomyces japonicus yFS275]EEB08019.1 cytoskeletal protein Syp1 [Schizosaccharomyces japonicus yFS275]
MDALAKTEYVEAFLPNFAPKDSMTVFRRRLERIRSDNDRLAHWLRERTEIERDYAVRLQKLANSMNEGNVQELSLSDAWLELERDMQLRSKLHNSMAKQLGGQVYKPISEFYTSSPQMASLRELESRLSSVARSMDPSSISKVLRSNKHKRGQSQDGQLMLDNNELISRTAWDSEAPFAFEKLQTVDEERLIMLKQVYLTVSSLENQVGRQLNESSETCMAIFSTISAEEETIRFASETVKNGAVQQDASPVARTQHSSSSRKEESPEERPARAPSKFKSRMNKLFRRKTVMIGKKKHSSESQAPLSSRKAAAGRIAPSSSLHSNSDDDAHSVPEASSLMTNGTRSVNINPAANHIENEQQQQSTQQQEHREQPTHTEHSSVPSSSAVTTLPQYVDVPQPNARSDASQVAVKTQAERASLAAPSISESSINASSSPMSVNINPTPVVQESPEERDAALERVSHALRQVPSVSRRTRSSDSTSRLTSPLSSPSTEMPMGMHIPPRSRSTLSIHSNSSVENFQPRIPELPNVPKLSSAIVAQVNGLWKGNQLQRAECDGSVYLVWRNPESVGSDKKCSVRLFSPQTLSSLVPTHTGVQLGNEPNSLDMPTSLIMTPTQVAKFQVPLEGSVLQNTLPLLVMQKWKHEETVSSMVAFVLRNPLYNNSAENYAVDKLSLLVSLGENVIVKSCRSSPAGEFSRKTSKLRVNFNDVTVPDTGLKVVARFEIEPNGVTRVPTIEYRMQLKHANVIESLVQVFSTPENVMRSSTVNSLEGAYDAQVVPTLYTTVARQFFSL